MNERADLHLHTTASDGAWSPTALVDAAYQVGLRIIAVTDHDTIDGIEEATDRGRQRGIEVIPGVELSVHHAGQEVHLLGYFVDTEHQGLRESLAACQAERVERIERMVARLAELGYRIALEDVKRIAKHGSMGRPHVARVLVKNGYVSSVATAFDQLLAEGRPAYVPRSRLGLTEGVSLIHEAGGLAVCAHPGLLRDDTLLQDLVLAGMDGIEVVHSEHDAVAEARYADFSSVHNLLRTGGSDCHGPGIKRDLYIGKYTIPVEWVTAMRNRLAASEESPSAQPAKMPRST